MIVFISHMKKFNNKKAVRKEYVETEKTSIYPDPTSDFLHIKF